MSNAPIVVAVDGSPTSLAAVAWAAKFGHRRSSALHLVNSATLPVLYGATVAFTQSDFDMVHADGERILAEAKQIATDVAGPDAELEISAEVVTGPIIPALLDHSAKAALLVVGSRGLGAFTRSLVGSVSSAVTRHAACPVAVVKDDSVADAVGRTGPIVVGVDGSENSMPAVKFAFAAAAAHGDEVLAVHAWSDASQFSIPEMQFPAVAESEAAVLSAALAGCRADYPDVAVRTLTVRDRPARNILEQSQTAQFVVVGSHGRGGFKGMLIGSTSQGLLHSVECPIVIVRHHS
jgi:nucleotide-binding universal stress UspA family protein